MKESFTKMWALAPSSGNWLLKSAVLSLLLLSVCMPQAWAQSINVSGKVTDGLTNEGLPGVNILIKGTGTGTVTDMDGNYKLAVPGADAVLVFSYIGYVREEITVGTKTNISVALNPDLEQLSEVVVVGYGTQKKADITGAVAVVDAAEMKKYATSDVSQLLQGRTPGVSVTSGGQPGAVPNVRIRGISTINGGQPLYVVDGMPLQNPPRDFNPNDVESMQVLKDASAAAIYGSRAANGVVIITTKQGRKNTPLKIEYNGYYGIDQVAQRIPVTSREQYQMLQNETQDNGAYLNQGHTRAPGNDPSSPDFIDDIDTDWQKEGIKNGSRQNHNVVLSGGGDNTTYNVSLDYFGNDGTFVGNGPSYDRYSGRINTTAEKGIVKVGQSLFYSRSNENSLTFRPDILFGNQPSLIGNLITAIPTMPVYDENRDGGFGGTSSTIERAISLNAIGFNSLIDNTVDVDRILGTAWGEVALLDRENSKLSYKLNLSYDRTTTEDYSFQPSFDLGYFFQTDNARLNRGNRSWQSGLIENTLNYELTAGKHTLSLLAGQMYQQFDFNFLSGGTQNLTAPYFPSLASGSGKSANGIFEKNALSSYLGRANYNFGDRYLITATLRRDGSSKFAPQYRFGYFPSVALGWKLHNEEFLKLPQFITELKLRGSYGALGNSEIAPYQYTPTINANIPYNFGGQAVVGGLQTSLVAEDLRWETKITSNAGFDAIFLDGAFDLSAEYYRSTTEDVLVGVPIPGSTGSINQFPLVNAASLRNSGFEFQAGYHKLKGDLTFDVSANLYTLKNEVLSLGGFDEPIYGIGARTQIGSEIGQHYGWQTQGIFQSDEEVKGHAFQSEYTAPGDLIFKDQLTVDTDGDGKFDAGDGVINPDDRVFLGSALPSLYYGLNIGAGYKNFDLTVFASGMGDYLINSRLYRDLMHTQGYGNYHEDILDRWTEDNRDTNIPRLVAGDPNDNNRDSDREGWLQNGTHLRINTVSLGYKLPEGLIKGLSSARVYVTGQNLYTFQAYKGFNPDFAGGIPVGGDNNATFSPGFDFGSFPRPRTVMVGVQVAF